MFWFKATKKKGFNLLCNLFDILWFYNKMYIVSTKEITIKSLALQIVLLVSRIKTMYIWKCTQKCWILISVLLLPDILQRMYIMSNKYNQTNSYNPNINFVYTFTWLEDYFRKNIRNTFFNFQEKKKPEKEESKKKNISINQIERNLFANFCVGLYISLFHFMCL